MSLVANFHLNFPNIKLAEEVLPQLQDMFKKESDGKDWPKELAWYAGKLLEQFAPMITVVAGHKGFATAMITGNDAGNVQFVVAKNG